MSIDSNQKINSLCEPPLLCKFYPDRRIATNPAVKYILANLNYWDNNLEFPQKSLNNLKNELGSVKGSKAEKEQEVERLTKELMVNIFFHFLFCSFLFFQRQCARSSLG